MSVLTLGEVVRTPTILSCGRVLACYPSASMTSLALNVTVGTDVACQFPLPVVHTGQLSLLFLGKLFLALGIAELMEGFPFPPGPPGCLVPGLRFRSGSLDTGLQTRAIRSKSIGQQ